MTLAYEKPCLVFVLVISSQPSHDADETMQME